MLTSLGYVIVTLIYMYGNPTGPLLLWSNAVCALFLVINAVFCFLSWDLSIREEGPPPDTDWWNVGNWLYTVGTALYCWQAVLMFDPTTASTVAIINVPATTVFLIDAIVYYFGYHHWW